MLSLQHPSNLQSMPAGCMNARSNRGGRGISLPAGRLISRHRSVESLAEWVSKLSHHLRSCRISTSEIDTLTHTLTLCGHGDSFIELRRMLCFYSNAVACITNHCCCRNSLWTGSSTLCLRWSSSFIRCFPRRRTPVFVSLGSEL